MTDFEWELNRGMRANLWAGEGRLRRTNRSLEEYAALEYPRESPAWLLGSAERTRATAFRTVRYADPERRGAADAA